jgi:hypothetical protein
MRTRNIFYHLMGTTPPSNVYNSRENRDHKDRRENRDHKDRRDLKESRVSKELKAFRCRKETQGNSRKPG